MTAIRACIWTLCLVALAAVVAPAVAQNHPDDIYWDPAFGNPGAIDSDYGRPRVHALALDAGGLYVGGILDYIGGVAANNIAYWDGSQWHALGSGVDDQVYALAVHDGKLYAGGFFYHAGGVQARHIAYWDEQNWSRMGIGVTEIVSMSPIQTINVYQGEIYAGGGYTSIGGVDVNGLARWDGSLWHDTGFGDLEGAVSGAVFAMSGEGDNLWIGGWLYDRIDYMVGEGITRFDGNTWSEFLFEFAGTVWSIVEVEHDMYIGGWFTRALGGVFINNVAHWDGAAWRAMRGGTNGQVLELYAVGTDVYAIGNFSRAGGRTALGAARWDGNNWHPFSSGLDLRGWNFAIAARPSGEMFCGGSFQTAGGVTSYKVGRWYNPVSYPSVPSPPHGASNLLNSTTLAWDATGTPDDPVYTLSDATTYYWKVVAKDGTGNHATGVEWKFTTEDLVTSKLVVSSVANRCGDDTVTIDVSIEDADVPVGAAGFDLEYDPTLLTFVACDPGGLTQGWQTFECADLPGAVRVGGYDVTPIPQGSYGTFARLTFLSNCCAFDSTVTSALEPVNLVDGLAGLRPIGGEYTCEYFVPDGDVNDDGMVTTSDAYCAFDGYLAWPVELPNDCGTSGWEIRSDVDCNGVVTPGDARCILSQSQEGTCSFCGGEALVSSLDQASSGAAAAAVVSAGRVLRIGDDVVIRIDVSGAPSLSALGFEVLYDGGVLEYDGAARTALTQGFEQFDDVLVEDGCVRVGGYRSGAFDASSGTAVTELRFHMLTASPQGIVTIQNFVDDVEGSAVVTVDLDAVVTRAPARRPATGSGYARRRLARPKRQGTVRCERRLLLRASYRALDPRP